MKHIENDIVDVYYSEKDMESSIARLSPLISNRPFILRPFRGLDNDIKAAFSVKGFQLYPTVKKTTLFFDAATNTFFKILHPLSVKNRILFCLADRARAIYNISEQLSSERIRVQKVVAYGMIKKGRLPFFAVKKAEGESLYDIMIRGKRTIDAEACRKVIDEIAGLHSLGFWLGDAHLSHIFMKDSEVSGIIDIDSIRKVRWSGTRHLAKDLAGLDHPELPLTPDEKRSLLDHYMNSANIRDKKGFIRLLKHYKGKRWKH